MKTIYLDHSATTPMRPEVIDAMRHYQDDAYGNPSSLYDIGAYAKRAINKARKDIASLIGADPMTVFFTSGGTESTNWAIKGLVFSNPDKPEIITTPIEHHATHHTCDFLTSLQRRTVLIPVDHEGFVDIKTLEQRINNQTLMVSIIHANNEVGTIQHLDAIASITRKHHVYLHVDAVQSLGHIPLDVTKTAIDLLTLSAHKFYGPKGIGILYVRKGLALTPLIHGGAQEMKHRAGTENVPAIVGMAKAMELAITDMDQQTRRLRALSEFFYSRIKDRYPAVRLNGPAIGTDRLPGHLSLSFPHINGFALAYQLNRRGVFISTGSACSAYEMKPSHVLRAINVPESVISGTIRITLGRTTTEDDLIVALDKLADAMDSL